MNAQEKTSLVVGIDYGTDSCRVVVINPYSGEEIAQHVTAYPRWARGQYCDPAENRFRQHPRDYIESLETAMGALSGKVGPEVLSRVKGIAIDTTASTPCAVDASGTPLSLTPEFAEDPDAMFVLWKDHTAVKEAAAINARAKSWGGEDYTKYESGIYSSEWYWAKALHVLAANPKVAAAAHSFLEHADWMPALLTATPFSALRRSRCVAGHKVMWHRDFGGYPSVAFLEKLSPALARIQPTLGTETFENHEVAGRLSAEWARRLGLPAGIVVAVGSIDAHIGAIGAGVRPGVLVKVMGTSTCDMIVAPKPAQDEKLVAGICGQVDGSIVPGMLGYEAGQSAFGDVYAWFKNLLLWPIDSTKPSLPQEYRKNVEDSLMTNLEKEAAKLDPASSAILAVDWLNGRRTPDANQLLKGAITGLTLGTTAPMIYRALIEATAFGSRAIVERFQREGVPVERIVAIGGVARKSNLVMQIVADVLNRPIDVIGSDQTVAMGAAMCASVAAGIYGSIAQAQAALVPATEKTVRPTVAGAAAYEAMYQKYLRLGGFMEGSL